MRNAGDVRGQIIDCDRLRRHTIEKLLGQGAFSLLGLVRLLRVCAQSAFDYQRRANCNAFPHCHCLVSTHVEKRRGRKGVPLA